jgi:hypothetical protein
LGCGAEPASCDGALDVNLIAELAILKKTLLCLPPHLVQPAFTPSALALQLTFWQVSLLEAHLELEPTRIVSADDQNTPVQVSHQGVHRSFIFFKKTVDERATRVVSSTPTLIYRVYISFRFIVS